MAAPKSARGRRTGRRVVKKNVAQGHAYIKSTFNNTIVSITDPKGAVISWASSVSRAPVSPLRSLPRWLPRTLLVRPWSTV